MSSHAFIAAPRLAEIASRASRQPGIGLLILDPEGRVVLWSEGARSLLGWERHEVLGRRLPAVAPGQEREFRDRLTRASAGEECPAIRRPCRDRAGGIRELVVSLRPLECPAEPAAVVLGILSVPAADGQIDVLVHRAAALELELAWREMEALKSRLAPHFLFNSLQAVSVLLKRGEGELATRSLADFTALLRQVLRCAQRLEVPLGEEIALVRRYLEIQKLRIGDRLTAGIRVQRGTRDLLLPGLLLQILVENALWHGIGPRRGPARIEIEARRVGEQLGLTVTDDGVGLPDGWELASGAGIGLQVASAQLRLLYGEDQALTLRRREGGGTVARIVLPCRRAIPPEDAGRES